MKTKIQQFLIVILFTVALTGSVKSAGTFSEKSVICDTGGECATVSTNSEGDSFLNVHTGDFHYTLINEWFHKHSGDQQTLTLSAPTGTTTLSVVDATTFDVGEYVDIMEGNTNEKQFPQITAKVGNLLTFNKPIDNTYTTSATAEIVDIDMADIAGTLAAPQFYIVEPPINEIWHIKRFMISCTDGTAPDYSNFCGIASLTNGVMLGVSNSATTTLTMWQQQSDMVNDMYDVSVQAKTGGGEWGLGGRWTPGNVEVTIKLDGTAGEKLIILIQDDITAVSQFKIKAQGHVEGY